MKSEKNFILVGQKILGYKIKFFVFPTNFYFVLIFDFNFRLTF